MALLQSFATIQCFLVVLLDMQADDPAREPAEGDRALDSVAEWFETTNDMVGRFGRAIRQSFDEVFDGQRTGRYNLDQLSKTEKTYIGTKIEIVVQAEFGLQRGRRMDYLVIDHEVDAKWSMRSGGWMIPTEAVGELCLCLTADDHRSTFSVGLIRADIETLRSGQNKDSKKQFSPSGLEHMRWLAHHADLPDNLLLHIEDSTRAAILDRSLSGQRRINELFHRIQERIIRREVVLTVAQQDDGPKRVRDARKHLAAFDVIILGHQESDPLIAEAFGLPVPRKGEWISVTVTDAEPESPGSALVNGAWRRRMFPTATPL